MKDLEPITREETMLAKVAGQDVPTLEPVTREEYFLAKAGGQDVPELEPVTRKEYFLADVIEAIESGGGGDLGEKTITANGTYNASDDSLDGYSKVMVDVQGASGYTNLDIVERTPIIGDVVHTSGNQNQLLTGMFFKTNIKSFMSTVIVGADQGLYAFRACPELVSVSLPNMDINNNSKLNYCFCESAKLESVSLPKVKSTGTNIFQNCTSLTTVNMPAYTSVTSYGFSGCTALQHIDLPACTRLNTYAFDGCTSLTALVLRSYTLCVLANVNALQNTPLRGKNGYSGHVYVPSSMIASYQSASNWSTLVSNYPNLFAAIEGSEYE